MQKRCSRLWTTSQPLYLVRLGLFAGPRGHEERRRTKKRQWITRETRRGRRGRKKVGEHERNARRRVRKSECHCRNLRTLTSSWLVPPSSWSQSPLLPPFPSATTPLPLVVLFVRSLSRSLSHLRVSLQVLSSPSIPLPLSLAADYASSSSCKFRVFRDDLRSLDNSVGDMQRSNRRTTPMVRFFNSVLYSRM